MRHPQVKLGFTHVMGGVWDIAKFHSATRNFGRMPSLTHCYVTETFPNPPAVGGGIADEVKELLALGVTPIISCMGEGNEGSFPGMGSPHNPSGTETWNLSGGVTNANAISTGAQNADLDAWADWLVDIAAYGTIVVRPWREMNGDWYPWSRGGTVDGAFNEPAVSYIQGWRAAYARFQTHLSGNADLSRIKWCWNPAGLPFSTTAKNFEAKEWWPGDDVVDIIAMDSYNEIDQSTGEMLYDWRYQFVKRDSASVGPSISNADMFYPLYVEQGWTNTDGKSHVAGSKPCWIGETNLYSGNSMLKVSSNASVGATSVSITALEGFSFGSAANHAFIASGTVLDLPYGYQTTTTANCAVGATSVSVSALPVALTTTNSDFGNGPDFLVSAGPKRDLIAALPRFLVEQAPKLDAVVLWWAGGSGTRGGYPNEQGTYPLNDFDFCRKDWQRMGNSEIFGDRQDNRRFRQSTPAPMRV